MSQTKAQLIDPVDGTIVNADINASAAIAGSKISPSFTANTTITAASPVLRLADSTDPQSDGGSIGKIEFFGNDGSSGGVDVRSFIQTISTNSSGNAHALIIGLGESNNAPTEKIRILGDGKVGIGTTSPTEKLHVVGDTRIDGSLQMNDNNSHVKLVDSGRVDFGTSADLRIFHSGGENFIRGNSSASRLYIDCCEDLQIRHLDTNGSNAEKMIRAVGDGAVELYHDSSKKFETLSTGNQSTGVHKFITGSGSTASDDNVVHIVAGGTADRGIMIGTGRGGGVSQNDGMGFIDAINSESNGYGSQLQFRVDGTAVMSIGHQSNDFVGIGTVTPGAVLDIGGLTNTAGENVNALKITRTDGLQLFGINWHVNNNEVSFSGNTKNYVFKNKSSSAESIRFPSTGGITFNGDTAVANALDDYEEGTWTPSLLSGNGFAFSSGRYVKIGAMVYAFWEVTMTSNSVTSHLIINNLPFTSIDHNASCGGTGRDYQNYDIENGPIYHVPKANTQIQFYKNAGQTYQEQNGSGHNFRGCSIYQTPT